MSDEHMHLALVTYCRPFRRFFRKTYIVRCWNCSYRSVFTSRPLAEMDRQRLDDLAFPIGRGMS